MAPNQPTPDFDDELLSAYVDNELTPAERAAVEQRLRTDERARQTLAELQRAADAVKALPARRLGRDLTANIWAAVSAEQSRKLDAQQAAEPAVLTLPPRDSGMGRGLIWAALAVAAAIMLMVLRPGAELQDQGSVAKTAPRPDAKAPKDPKEDANDLARVESAVLGRGASAAARQESANAESQIAAAPMDERGSDEGAAPRSDVTQSRGSELRDNQAPAPRALGSVASSAPIGVGASKYAAEAEPTASPPLAQAELSDREAAEAIVADAASGTPLRTIEVSASGGDGVATFERMLADHQITMVEDPTDEFATRAATESDALEAKATAAEKLETEGAEGDGDSAGVAGQAAGGESAPTAILVEASPEVIAGILATLQPQAESRYAFRGLADRAAERDALADGATGFDGANTREAGTAKNRAWRVPFDSNFNDGAVLAKLAAKDAAAPPSTTAAAPAGARGGRGGGFGGGGGGLGGGGGFGGRALDADEPRERVLFIVRPE